MLSFLHLQGVWIGADGGESSAAPPPAPSGGGGGLDLMSLQGVWFGGFRIQLLAQTVHNETITLNFQADVSTVTDARVINVTLGLGIVQGVGTQVFGNVISETLVLGFSKGVDFTAPQTFTEALGLSFSTKVSVFVVGGCGPAEVWDNVVCTTAETWVKGPC